MGKIVIIGSSGHAKVVIDIVEAQGRYAVAGLVNSDGKERERMFGYPVLGRDRDLPALLQRFPIDGALVAIGDNFARAKVAARLRQACPTLPLVSAIHPKAAIAREVTIGEGTVIMAGAVVNPNCAIGRFCILNTNSSLDHDSVMEDFSSLAPRVTVGGSCRIGEYSAVCIGAVLIHGVHVDRHAVIGAGATVLKDVEPYCVAYGTPATKVRARKSGEKYL